MTQTENPRAVAGDNQAPDYARRVTDQMAEDYAESVRALDAMMAEAREMPATVEDDATALKLGALVKKLRDADARIEKFRVVEKEPYLRGGEAVDAFFFGQRDRVGRRKRTDKPGAADVLQGRIDAYQQEKLRQEQERRRLEWEEAQRKEREAREKADREAREAEEARLAAERARKPETVAAKAEVAAAKEASASASTVQAEAATEQARETHIATLARPADIVRTRGDDGVTLTMATEPYAVIEDDALLDKEKLWPFFTVDAKEKALRAWARTTGHSQQMAGASIGKRPRSVVR